MGVALLVLVIIAPYAQAMIDNSGCNTDAFCFKQNEDCKSSSDCSFFLKYRVNSSTSMVDVYMSYKKSAVGWLGMGLNDKGQMGGASAVICVYIEANNTMLYASTLPNHASPNFTTAGAAMMKMISRSDDVFECHFQRPLAASGDLVQFNQEHFVVFAVGPLLNDKPRYHGQNNYIISKAKIDLRLTKGLLYLESGAEKGAQVSVFVTIIACFLVNLS